MQAKEKAANFHDRAKKVREIARGLFDKTERRIVLRFVADSEKVVVESRASAGN
jgi:hypothetical protein